MDCHTDGNGIGTSLQIEEKQLVRKFLQTKLMQIVVQFLTVEETLSLQLLDKEFYQTIIPNSLHVLAIKKIETEKPPKMHLYIFNQSLWGLEISGKTDTREVEFEEDKWIHENQFEFDESSDQRPKKLFDFKDIGMYEEDEELRIGAQEEVLIQNTFQIDKDKFLMFPVFDNVYVRRGLIVELGNRSKGEKPNVRKTSRPPRELIRPGIITQTRVNQVTDMLLCGGNEDRQCYSYNILRDVWTLAGVLPSKHAMTDIILVQYNEKQTLTLFATINYENNKYQLKSAINNGNVGLNPSGEYLNWLADSSLDIAINNFHIKCAFIHQNKLVIFSRGQPSNVNDKCCSFFLIFDLLIDQDGFITVIDLHYNFIKLDALSYAEFQSQVDCWFDEETINLVIRLPQEDNHAQGFPRQLLEFTIPKGDLSQNLDLFQIQDTEKIITVEFKEN